MSLSLVLVCLGAAAGGGAQALTGFGFAIVAVPMLALATGPRDAVVIATLLSLCLTAVVSVRQRAHVDLRLVSRVGTAAVIGMPVGLALLRAAPSRLLEGVVAVVTLVCLVQPAPSRGRRGLVTAGVVSGAALTATGINGPPLVAAVRRFQLPAARELATLQALFAIEDVCAVAGFGLASAIHGRTVLLALGALPAVGLGWMAGSRARSLLPAVHARRLVLTMILCSVATLALKAVA